MVEDAVFAANQLELLPYDNVRGMIPDHLFTDLTSTLESLASSKQIITNTLRMTKVDLKERLLKGDVTSYTWLPKEMIWADFLSYEKKFPESLEDVLFRNTLKLQNIYVNKVKAFGQEVIITNIQNSRAVTDSQGSQDSDLYFQCWLRTVPLLKNIILDSQVEYS